MVKVTFLPLVISLGAEEMKAHIIGDRVTYRIYLYYLIAYYLIVLKPPGHCTYLSLLVSLRSFFLFISQGLLLHVPWMT